MKPLLLSLWVSAAPALLCAAASPASAAASADSALQVQLRGHGRGAADPQIVQVPGLSNALLIEVPGGRIDHSGAMAPPAGTRLAQLVEEVVLANSRSRQRAVVTLRLRSGAVLRPEDLQATLDDGTLRVALREAATAPVKAAAPVPAAAPVAPKAEPVHAGSDDGAAAHLTSGAQLSGGAVPAQASVPWARALAGLAALGAAGFLAMRLRPRRGAELRPTAIDIVASRALGKHQRLLVVDVEQQRFLLSASEPGGLRLVSSINAEGRSAGLERADETLGDMFADMMSAHSGDKGTGKAASPEGEAHQRRRTEQERLELAAEKEWMTQAEKPSATPPELSGTVHGELQDNTPLPPPMPMGSHMHNTLSVTTAPMARVRPQRTPAPAAPAAPVDLDGATPLAARDTLILTNPAEVQADAPAAAPVAVPAAVYAPQGASAVQTQPALLSVDAVPQPVASQASGAVSARPARPLVSNTGSFAAIPGPGLDAAPVASKEGGPDERRPNLQVIEGARSGREERSRADLQAEPPRSSDVAGLVALRQHRGGGRW